MAGKDDGLGLSLSLRCPENQNLVPSPTPVEAAPPTAPFPMSFFPFMHKDNNAEPSSFFRGINMSQHKSSTNTDPFQSPTTDNNAEPRSLFRGIDMNRALSVIECDDDQVIVSSPNNSSTVSSISGKRSEREENDGDIDDEDGGDAAARKKLRLSKEQAAVLEETFKEHNTLNPKEKMALAKQLNLRPRQVEVWFQNRRARAKLKQTEVDCEYLRRCCENLTDENRRLQKEVNELRALKLSPQFYMNMSPPTTLTMCPQCERVAVSSSSPSAAASSVIAPANGGINRQPHRPMPMTPWAAIIPPQSLDINRPRS